MISVKYPHVDYDAAGVAVIAGTTTRVAEIVLDHLAHQWDAKQIGEHHKSLRMGQIHSALAYYYDHEDERQREVQSGGNRIEEFNAKPNRAEIVKKLKCLGLLP